jgi:hypothetical protein
MHLAITCLFVSSLMAQDSTEDPSRIHFSKEILPILSDACFQCHGPDAKARKADLRLDKESSALGSRDTSSPVIIPGKAHLSTLIQRLVTEDADEKMPPPELGRPLDASQIDLLRRWINQGAKWGRHWSLNPVVRPLPPRHDVHPVDAFIEHELKREGLQAQASADRRTLIRRLALDLTGLPPRSSELNAILSNQTESWWDEAIDRYLASPAYGERMAWHWLDAARYADSNGYQGDRERTMWPWRDWVVDTFNRNLPWDTFTLWQLAGDLLPAPTHEQRLATGFCRNYMINGEGGRIAEENRVDYVMDMTETMGTVWLGATLNCARCHDHKYDPFTQKEYYQLFDFFNQTPVTGGGGDPQTAPILAVPSPDQAKAIADAFAESQSARKNLEKMMVEHAPAIHAWEIQRRKALSDPMAQDVKEADKENLNTLREALFKPTEERSKTQTEIILKAYITSDPPLAEARQYSKNNKERLQRLRAVVPKVMVMQDQENRRPTPMLERGLYHRKGTEVTAAIPASMPALKTSDRIPNRLDLARWLIRPDHPLTARVTVNRLWQQLFGTGLVKTAEDFGIQGEFPRHLELLDWLSYEFITSGWNVKKLLKTIMTSQAYQRLSTTTEALIEVDPENRLYARASRYRLPSWVIRDQALSAAGLLDRTLGGPPVNGYQPDGVWEDATFGNKKYRRDKGRKLYRRSLYTFWRRIIAPTLFFDTASRQTCNVDHKRTNSPLHALTTLNDTTFVEAARGLATRAMQGTSTQEAILHRAYAYILARAPFSEETEIWLNSLKRAREHFETRPKATEAWLDHGEGIGATDLDSIELAAWSTVCLGILNMDETLNRE